jgi:ankyrin repeat protein
LIHFAIKYSTPGIIKYIIDKGADLESRTRDNLCPIHLAIIYSTPEIILYLIDNGAKIDSVGNGLRAINVAIRHSTPTVIKYFVDKEIELKSTVSSYATNHAIKYSKPEVIKYFIDHKFFLESTDDLGQRPIHCLIEYRSRDDDLLIEMFESGIDLESEDGRNRQPIHYCIEYSTTPIIFYLMNMGVNLRCCDSMGIEPLYYAIKKMNVDVTIHIVDNIIAADPEFRSSDLINCIIEKSHETNRYDEGIAILSHLIMQGFPTDRMSNGFEPIHYVTYHGCIRLFEYLVKQGVNLESKTAKGEHTVDLAMGQLGILKYLIKIAKVDISHWPQKHCYLCGQKHRYTDRIHDDLCQIFNNKCIIL